MKSRLDRILDLVVDAVRGGDLFARLVALVALGVTIYGLTMLQECLTVHSKIGA